MSNRLEEIQDEIAKNNGYDSWEEYWTILGMTNDDRTMGSLLKGICMQYAKECSQAYLEKASENSKVIFSNNHLKTKIVDKESITNPDNIILL